MDTVRIHISIQIDTEDLVDTQMSVNDWNSLTDDERQAIVQGIWDDMAQADNGGISVVTDGAEEV